MVTDDVLQLKDSVIEGNDVKLRRKFEHICAETLSTRYSNVCLISDFEYNVLQESHRRYHNIVKNQDKGFIGLYDKFHNRHIYVASQQVGKSELFHIEFTIQAMFNVIKPCSNHDHSTYMSKSRKEWFTLNIEYVCLQMYDTVGNIVIFCNCGRSRSPMYVVAYFVLFHNMTVHAAMKHVEYILLHEREQVLDRHATLYDIVDAIANDSI